MTDNTQFKKDLETLTIDENAVLTVKFVTAKYKKLAKIRHPDREGGITSEFQELQSAYKRVINFLEGQGEVVVEVDDFETSCKRMHF